jgi:restriction system protein
MKMHENSMFALLLRSPWWVSFIVAGITIALSRLMVMKFDFDQLYAVFIGLPFIVIGSVAAWRQLRVPSEERVAAGLQSLRAMSWEVFCGALEAAFKSDGYQVNRLAMPGADLELTKAGRVSLVSGKRWKAAHAGVEPLRELQAVREARDAHECIYVAAGEVSDKAVAFAAANNIRLLRGAELALLPGLPKL